MSNRIIYLTLLVCSVMYSQKMSIDYQYFRGLSVVHNPEIKHLTNSHPEGGLFSLSWKPDGSKEWHHALNFPDYGINLQHVAYNLESLGHNYSVGFFYQFYFLNRHLSLRVSQGIGYNTNPYDKIKNPKNNAFGSHLLSNTLIKLQFQKERLFDNFGFQIGSTFSHFSNARLAAPNSGLNVLALHLGLQYHFHEASETKQDTSQVSQIKKPIGYQFTARSGANIGPIEGMPLRPLIHLSLLSHKRVNRYSSWQFGVEYFWSQYLKDVIEYYAVAIDEVPNKNPDINLNRVGVLVGHEWHLNQLSIEKQLGYYVYKGYQYESPIYTRIAFKYYIIDDVFCSLGLKSHGFRAEAMEVGLGFKF